MKVFATAAVASAAFLTLDGADAKQQGWHVKVSVHTKLVPMWGTCYTKDGGFQTCENGLDCIRTGEFYAQCLKKQPVLWDQCGGLKWVSQTQNQPWNVACVPNGQGQTSTCKMLSTQYYQCVPATTQHYYYKDHSNKHNDGTHHRHKSAEAHVKAVGENGQCVWKDHTADCEPALQCIKDSDYYGRCVKKNVTVWQQCGGKSYNGPWSATCADGSTCVKKDDWYSQCLFGQGQAPPSGTTPSVAPANGGGAEKWSQCGGQNFSGPTTCKAGSQCIKQSDYYSQCKPDYLPVGEMCGEKKQGSTWSHPNCENGAKCVASNADQSEFRCKN
ncbi:Endo-glucanase rce3, partial [Globisporangium splendens]